MKTRTWKKLRCWCLIKLIWLAIPSVYTTIVFCLCAVSDLTIPLAGIGMSLKNYGSLSFPREKYWFGTNNGWGTWQRTSMVTFSGAPFLEPRVAWGEWLCGGVPSGPNYTGVVLIFMRQSMIPMHVWIPYIDWRMANILPSFNWEMTVICLVLPVFCDSWPPPITVIARACFSTTKSCCDMVKLGFLYRLAKTICNVTL